MDNDYRRIINTHLQAIRVILSDAEIDELTKLITNRSISDKTLFSKTMSRPGIKYYYQYFKGSLLEYRQRTAGKTEKPIPFN